jgi:hypothetical protein
MKNFARLNQAGLFPSNVRSEGDLSPNDLQVINRLTSEELEALISTFNKVDQGRQSEVQNLMPVVGF